LGERFFLSIDAVTNSVNLTNDIAGSSWVDFVSPIPNETEPVTAIESLPQNMFVSSSQSLT
jgi:hypothetical protein